jgi:hypothetical protein
VPGSNDEDLHEEGIMVLLFWLHHHLEDITFEVPVHIQVMPAGLTERSTKEENCALLSAEKIKCSKIYSNVWH